MSEALNVLPGVGQVTVSFEEKLAVVELESGTDTAAIFDAIEKLGYTGELLESIPTKSPVNKKLDPDSDNSTEATYSSVEFAERVRVSALFDATAYRPGDEFRIGVVFDIEDGWHIYGNPVGPGVGRATTVEGEDMPGAESVVAHYAPSTKASQSFPGAGDTWIWENTGQTVHYLSGRIRDDAKSGSTTWKIKARAQACTATQCLPATITVPLSVTISPSHTSQQQAKKSEFNEYENTHTLDET